jgi:trehalose-6-phosphate synthase
MDWALYAFTSLLAIVIGFWLGRSAAPARIITVTAPAAAEKADIDASPAAAEDSADSESKDDEQKKRDEEAEKKEKEAALADANKIMTFVPSDFSVINSKRRVIIVAKQLPVLIRRDPATKKWIIEWDDHRNFIANLKVLKEKLGMDIKFVGYVGFDCPRDDEEELEELLAEFDCVPVFLHPELANKFFNGFCKSILWPLLHYIVPNNIAISDKFSGSWDELWQAYTAANTRYATVVAHTVESPSDWIWVHNYHLLLAPSFLRGKLPRSRIGLFIHTPFPSSDVFRMLPTRLSILSSLLQADLIGFHTFDYARHFLSCIKRVMDLDYGSLLSLALRRSSRLRCCHPLHLPLTRRVRSACAM